VRIQKWYAWNDSQMNLADEVYKEVLKRLNIKTALVIGHDKSELENGFITVSVEDNAEFDCVIIRNLKNSMLVNLALGNPVNMAETLVMKALLDKKRVYIVRSGIQYINMKRDIHVKLFELYKSYESAIIGYGAQIAGWDRVVTEKAVKDFYEMGGRVLSVPDNAVVTPLAMDFIKKNKMMLESR